MDLTAECLTVFGLLGVVEELNFNPSSREAEAGGSL